MATNHREQAMQTTLKAIAGVLVLTLLAGCAHVTGSQNRTAQVDADHLEKEIRQAVIECRVNARELDNIYDRLHNAAAIEAGRSSADQQLSYIQKTYLYVHQARLVADYQIRLLSDFHFIAQNQHSDFLTLRARDLDQAIYDLEDAASFLEVYAAFIVDRQALNEVENARQMIGGTIYLYEKLLETIRPVVKPAAPFTRDPYSPFSRGT